jgi:exodeoxyribonuclease VII large subunit
VWVVAEITEMNQRQGHLYLTLAESWQGQQLAQVKATLWASLADRLLAMFEQVTGQKLSTGMNVLLAVEVSIHARFGLSLSITDINPSFTLGDQEAKLQQIRQQLKTQGLWLLNKQKSLASDVFRIAVLSPAQAAGLGDFRSDANQLVELGLCEFDYFHASFQGSSASRELIQALEQIEQSNHVQPFDALVIIRGGGAKQDLMFLNEFDLAAAICRFPIPVLTGIGHERDSTILDEVAFSSFDTPSKTVSFIRQHIIDVVQKAQADWRRLQQYMTQQLHLSARAIDAHQQVVQTHSRQQLHKAKQSLESLRLACDHSVQMTFKEQHQGLTLWQSQITLSALHHCQRNHHAINQWQALLIPSAEQQMKQQRQNLTHYHQLLQSMHPRRVLSQGYTLVRNEQGKVITAASEAVELTQFTLYFSDASLSLKSMNASVKPYEEPNEYV